MPERYLIVNADDFGLSRGTNRGIIRAHEQGIVTSASLMVRQPAAAEAAEYARARRGALGVGLHLDLGEWVYRDGQWVSAYQVVPADDAASVADELRRQLDAFERLVGAPPTHIDSHQHAHLSQPALSAAAAAAKRLGVPLRRVTPAVAYCGNFYGQSATGEPLPDAVSAASLLEVLRSLPAGVTELACHPGEDEQLASTYRLERLREVEALCDPAVRAWAEESGTRLIHFGALLGLGAAKP